MSKQPLIRSLRASVALIAWAGVILCAGCLGDAVELLPDGGRLTPPEDAALDALTELPDVGLLDARPAPDLDLADAMIVDLDLADEGAPDAEAPDMEIPDLGAPDMEIPDLGAPDMETPRDLLLADFYDNVQVAMTRHQCVDCHLAPGGSGGFGVNANPPEGSDALYDNYQRVSALCNPANPEGSPFYLRATVRHFGSAPFDAAEAALLRAWISGL